MRNITKLLSVVAILSIIGCNSSSSSGTYTSSDTNTSIITTQTAQLTDSPVANIDYSTDTMQGVTDNNGYFNFSSKDSKVIFKVGDLIIGEFNLSKLNSDRKIFPADLVGVERTNLTNDNLLKIIRFLQTLDEDNNVSNGITIDENAKDLITQYLQNNPNINRYLSENNITALKTLMKDLNKTLMVENTARDNYKKTLISNNITPEYVPFTTVWSVSSNDTVYIDINTAYEYNYSVDWGDGNITDYITGSSSHKYTSGGTYTVKISGIFPQPKFNDYKLKAVSKWGDIQWKDFTGSFVNCAYLEINATDIPDMSEVNSTASMFSYATNFNSDLSEWNTSHITIMKDMFYNAQKFNQPLNNWDVSNVTDMSYMFFEADSFNQPLDKWNVSSVTNMDGMFQNALEFNQSVDKWNVGKVTSMQAMFYNAKNFNQPLNDWNVSSVTNMGSMFSYALSFNQPLNKWNVGKVTNMAYMFYNAGVFDQNISSWNVDKVTNMAYMFALTPKFNQPLNDWNVSSVTDMDHMFYGAEVFDQNISGWNVGKVTNMYCMFNRAPKFNQPLNDWNVSSVTDMGAMFAYAYDFNQPLDKWDVSSVTFMYRMFYYANSFDQNISMWTVTQVTNYDEFDTNTSIEGTDKEPPFGP